MQITGQECISSSHERWHFSISTLLASSSIKVLAAFFKFFMFYLCKCYEIILIKVELDWLSELFIKVKRLFYSSCCSKHNLVVVFFRVCYFLETEALDYGSCVLVFFFCKVSFYTFWMEQCETLPRVRNSLNAQQELNCYLNGIRVMPKNRTFWLFYARENISLLLF